MEEIKHTPGSWQYEWNDFGELVVYHRNGILKNIIYVSKKPALLTKEEIKEWKKQEEANADFIVRSCNAHDDLVAALKMFIEIDEHPIYHGAMPVFLRGFRDKAKQALAELK